MGPSSSFIEDPVTTTPLPPPILSLPPTLVWRRQRRQSVKSSSCNGAGTFRLRLGQLSLTTARMSRRSTSNSCAVTGCLLARPDDPVHEGDFGQGETAILEHRIEAFEFDALGCHPAKLLGHH